MQELTIHRMSRTSTTRFATNIKNGLHIVKDVEGTVWFKHKRNDRITLQETIIIK